MGAGERTIFQLSSKKYKLILNLKNIFLFLFQFNGFTFPSNLEIKPPYGNLLFTLFCANITSYLSKLNGKIFYYYELK